MFFCSVAKEATFLLWRGVRAVRTETNIYKAQFRSVEFYDRMHILIRLNLVQVFNFLLKTNAGTKQSRKAVRVRFFPSADYLRQKNNNRCFERIGIIEDRYVQWYNLEPNYPLMS